MSSEPPSFETHRALPATRLGRDDLRELLGMLSEPDLADGLLVHAGFHLRLPGADDDRAFGLERNEGDVDVPPLSSDFFLTVDFGAAEAYRRQVVVAFEPDAASLFVLSDDEAWTEEVVRRVEGFLGSRRTWFHSRPALHRGLLVGGMGAVAASAWLALAAPAHYRWPALWLFLGGLVGVIASHVLPRLLPHSLVRLDTPREPSPTRRERLAVGIVLAAFSAAAVGFGVALLLALTGQ